MTRDELVGAMAGALTKQEWIEKCADRFQSRGGVSKREIALDMAEATWAVEAGAHGEDVSDPADAADSEMSYWDADG